MVAGPMKANDAAVTTTLGSFLDLESKRQAVAAAMDDASEGAAAFVEKRLHAGAAASCCPAGDDAAHAGPSATDRSST